MNINYFMNLANQEAKKAYIIDEVPVGAVLVDNFSNKIICKAYNQTITLKNSTKHAEMIVIEKGCKKKKSQFLYNTTIFTTLEPCAMCASAISEARISRIYFGAYDEKKGSLESIMKIYNIKNFFVPEYYGGINENESQFIIKKFFEKK